MRWTNLPDWAKAAVKAAFYLVMAGVVIVVARSVLTDLSAEKMKAIFAEVPPWHLAGLGVLGLAAFSATGLYDLIAARHLDAPVRARDAARVGLTAQAFTNFAGMGGLTGGAIRTREYVALGAGHASAVGVSASVWASNTLGLLVLLAATAPLAERIDARLVLVPLVAVAYIPIFLFAGRIHVGKLDLRRTVHAAMPMREKLGLLAASTADWAAAGLFFWACVRMFGADVDPWHALFVYSMATIVGLLSFLPSGLGSFDVTVLVLFGNMGVDTSSMALALIVFRVAYYVVPWLIALVSWAGRGVGLDDVERRRHVIADAIWVAMILASALLLVSAITPEIASRVEILDEALPPSLRRASHLTVLMVAVVLLVLARGIRKRIRRSWELALTVTVIAMISLLARGLDWEEAVLLGIVAVALVAARKAFTVDVMPPSWRGILPSALTAAVLPLGLFIWHDTHPPMLLYSFLAGLAAIAAMFSRHRVPTFTGPGADDVARFEDLLARFGGNAYTHLFWLGDKEIFFSGDGDAALLYRPHGTILYVLGDPFGDPASYAALIDEFVGYADEHRMGVVVYELDEKHLGMLADEGFSFTKLGEDATVDISGFTVVGNKGKSMRRMTTHFAKQGLTFDVRQPPFGADEIAALREVSDAWLGARQEMGFSLGCFDESYLQRAPIAYARSGDGIVGFATIMPVDDATASVDLMRILPDAPGGTMDGIFAHLMAHAHERGYTRFNLGMAPMSNTGTHKHSHAREKLLKLVYDYGGKVYGFHGLRSYKQKFRPEWRSRYLAYLDQTSLPAALLGLLELVQRPTKYDHVDMPQSTAPGSTP